MKEKLLSYLDANFPDLCSDIYIRFELGEPFKNGSDERMEQVITRVVALFEDLFDTNDNICIYIKDWEIEVDPMFGDTTPIYIYQLLAKHVLKEETMYKLDENIDEMGNSV